MFSVPSLLSFTLGLVAVHLAFDEECLLNKDVTAAQAYYSVVLKSRAVSALPIVLVPKHMESLHTSDVLCINVGRCGTCDCEACLPQS